MNNIICKKTFWLNVGLSTFSVLGCLFYLFFQMGIEVVNKFELIFDFFFLVTPLTTVITFYKNQKGLINTVSIILNIIVLIIYSMFVLRIGHISVESLATLFVWSIPFIINVKQLRELRNV